MEKTVEKVAAVNYTAEQVETAKEMYAAGQAVEVIALAVGHTVRSVIAKLVKEGVYVSKAKTNAVARVTKATLIAGIAAAMGVTEESVESLEKATKEALESVLKALSA